MNDSLTEAKNWAVSLTPLEPNQKHYCKTRDIFQARLEHFKDEMIKSVGENTASLITAVAGEIGNNSFDHNLGNWPDILGIYFSYSLTQKRIILADRGLGILATLKKVKPQLTDHKEALKTAFTETISGRAPENRGNGLKFVRKVITENSLRLSFQTGNALLQLKDQDVSMKIEETEDKMRGCLAVIEY
ncbi:hypothetical protein A2630_00100 [Candidatus Woesebacteria bacterium RIFCSPHIGHO2_01_FULL_44_10]|uniref:Histidine kinase/HSP90-like ATPase domain-containing protein n=1 Tax=Candidatus Woesebacteria bacterium RIFCSPLOWO2_01_FULL_44_14 TaxID=1802525 RepID=A0A1F8BXF2_9BACT|nr:MAG: hypothetical protein A2630_00100 [Candidatus Woesebacteria bacterium RIFCSPHIGHO2_01_FULL_44_10]OGM56292.1 MAG: hypothetical protein A3F62_03420 [Candidatus Woesebacteria bacterium RIFCSPHIGHO2_12_FULL_44_11]OGM68747.1 MAG: hypothetical protein A2975_05400 [Candidatus Woesebacteria bacterium RIFCSPLOWO2_01_FULL_44_14]